MKPEAVFCLCTRTRPYNPCIGAQMATIDTTKKVTTTSEKTGVCGIGGEHAGTCLECGRNAALGWAHVCAGCWNRRPPDCCCIWDHERLVTIDRCPHHGVATVATMALAALLDDQPTDLQKSREAYKRATARRRERNKR